MYVQQSNFSYNCGYIAWELGQVCISVSVLTAQIRYQLQSCKINGLFRLQRVAFGQSNWKTGSCPRCWRVLSLIRILSTDWEQRNFLITIFFSDYNDSLTLNLISPLIQSLSVSEISLMRSASFKVAERLLCQHHKATNISLLVCGLF